MASAIAVFGSSEPPEGSAPYELARKVGSLLARSGFVVITGGYGGVMEAASRGAVEAGGECIGVTTRAFRASRTSPNRFLTTHVEEIGLFERTRELIERSDGYIILPGKSGTLAELTFLWALHRAHLLGSRPIVLLGSPWRRYVDQVEALGLVDRDQIAITKIADDAERAVEAIRKGLE